MRTIFDYYISFPENKEWFDSMNSKVQEVVKAKPPNQMYQLMTTRQVCTIYSYSEPLSDSPDEKILVKIIISGSNFQVFGVNPDNLMPWRPSLN